MSPTFKFSKTFQNSLKPIFNFAKSKRVKLYLVGGILRDLLIKRVRENPDFDFCLKKGALNFGRSLAVNIKAAYVVLDAAHGACRLVKRIGNRVYTFDFTDFRGLTFEEDLLHRDFTINSIALELSKVFSGGDLNAELIDLHSGREDLKHKIIRLTHKRSFAQDPLRILRAFSFSSVLGFKLDSYLVKSAKTQAKKLKQVSAERVRDELFKILDAKLAYPAIAALDKIKIMEVIFPEIRKMRGIGQGPYHHLDVWQHTLETLKQLELLSIELKNNAGVQAYLRQVVSGNRKKLALLKLAAILHDVGKPKAMRREKKKIIFHGHERVGLGLTRLIARRLKLSNEECASLERIVLWHLRPGYLADSSAPTPRAKFRYFRDTGADALAVLILSLADQRATKGPLTTALSRRRHEKIVAGLMKELFGKKDKKTAPLINGHDLMGRFHLPPSPLIGKILKELEELQAIGKLRSKAEAFKAASKLIPKL